MNYLEWFDLIQKICDEKGVMFHTDRRMETRYISCMELKDEINKRYLLGLKHDQTQRN